MQSLNISWLTIKFVGIIIDLLIFRCEDVFVFFSWNDYMF